MELDIKKGIVKKSEGEFAKHILKDFKSGDEFPLNDIIMCIHELQEGDIVEFAGRIEGNLTYLAIAGVEVRRSMN